MNQNMALRLYDVAIKILGRNVRRRENMHEVEDAFKMLESIGNESNVE